VFGERSGQIKAWMGGKGKLKAECAVLNLDPHGLAARLSQSPCGWA